MTVDNFDDFLRELGLGPRTTEDLPDPIRQRIDENTVVSSQELNVGMLKTILEDYDDDTQVIILPLNRDGSDKQHYYEVATVDQVHPMGYIALGFIE